MSREPTAAVELGDHHPILAGDAASAWLGIRVLRANFGDALIEMELRPEMLNGFNIGHGGLIFTFADSAFAISCNDAEAHGSTMTVASGADISFLRPALPNHILRAHAVVRSQGRSGLYDVQVTQHATADDPGEVIAEFRGRSRTIPARPTAS